jgi:hypothetical protein
MCAKDSYILGTDSLSQEDLEFLAEQHRDNLRLSFINSLGTPFVALLFRHMQESDSSSLITARESASGRIAGHVSLVSDLGRFYRVFLWHHGFQAAWMARKAIIDPFSAGSRRLCSIQ